jgi:hypothetical protein
MWTKFSSTNRYDLVINVPAATPIVVDNLTIEVSGTETTVDSNTPVTVVADVVPMGMEITSGKLVVRGIPLFSNSGNTVKVKKYTGVTNGINTYEVVYSVFVYCKES